MTHGNFARCVELQTFQRRRLDASATRHLARAELFTTELVLNLHAPSDARQFFEGYEADAPPLALAATAASFEAASVNCDFRVRDAWREGRSKDAAARAGETLRKQIGAAAATRRAEFNRWFGWSRPNFRILELGRIEVDLADF